MIDTVADVGAPTDAGRPAGGLVSQAPGDETSPAERAPFGAWWTLAVLLLFYVLAFVDRNILAMLVGPIKADLHLSDFQMSMVLGPPFAVFFALGGIPLGVAADRFSRRWVIFGGVIVWALATAASGLARSFPGLFGARMFVGVGEAALNPAAYSLLADKFPKSRLTTAIAIFQTGVRIGSALAFAVGGAAIGLATALGAVSWPLIGETRPWQLVLIMVGAPGLICAALSFTFREPPRKGRLTKGDPNLALLVGFLRDNAALLGLMLVGFSFVAICGNGLNAWVPAYMGRRFGWEPVRFGPILSLIDLIAAAALVGKGAIVDWLFKRGVKDAHLRFFLWLLAISIPLAWGAFFIAQPIWFLIAYGLLNMLAMAFLIYFSATLVIIVPNELRGQVSALFMSVFVIVGAGVGPTIVGGITTFVLRDEQKLGLALALMAGTCVTMALLVLSGALGRVRRAVTQVELLEATR